MLDVRYGNRRIKLKHGKLTIEVGSAENLLPTLQAVKEAVAAGDDVIAPSTVRIQRPMALPKLLGSLNVLSCPVI